MFPYYHPKFEMLRVMGLELSCPQHPGTEPKKKTKKKQKKTMPPPQKKRINNK